MTVEEYIQEKGLKPLSDKELAKGKSYLRIFGTNDPMPWSTIFTRLQAGQCMEDLAKMYGHGRKIALWAEKEGITKPDPALNSIVGEEIEHRKRMTAIADLSPNTAKTIMEMVNDVAPEFTQKVAMFSSELVDQARDKLKGDFIEASDLLALAKAVQTATDTTGHTQRHAASTMITAGAVQVEGFTFQLDAGPQEEAIDAEVEDAPQDVETEPQPQPQDAEE